MRKASFFVAASLLLFCGLASGQTIQQPTVYVKPDDSFSSAFAAGVEKKHVPVTLTSDPEQARYFVDFSGEQDKGSKARGVTTAILTGVYNSGAYDRVSMRVTDAKTKDVVFSYTCQKGGQHVQSVAECLAKHWKQHLEKN